MDPSAPMSNPAHLLAFLLPFIFVMIVIVFIPIWMICKKAGFSPWISLLIFIPWATSSCYMCWPSRRGR
jgi:hypothetical protein